MLIDIVTNISPSETPLLTGLPMGQAAKQTLHEYTIDTYASATDDAAAESSGFTAVDLVQPTRGNNVTQIFKEDIQVSETEIAVAGVTEPYNYQIQKNMVQHAKNIELALMAGSRASGNSGVARRLAGVVNSISTNLSARLSGSSLGQKDFDDMMQLIWTGAAGTGTGYVATEIYAGAALRRDISGFTTSVSRFIAQDDKKLVTPIDVLTERFVAHLKLNYLLETLCFALLIKVKICKTIKTISRKGIATMRGLLESLMEKVLSHFRLIWSNPITRLAYCHLSV